MVILGDVSNFERLYFCSHDHMTRIKLTQNGHKTVPLSSLLLNTVQSQENKTDELRLRPTQQQEIRDCCAHICTKTWLHHNNLDQAIALNGQNVSHTDRMENSGKMK